MRAVAIRFAPAAAASLVVAAVIATGSLVSPARGLALGCAVAAWAAPLFFSRTDVRMHASVVAGIAAVTAAGQVEGGLVYGIASGLFLLVALLAMRGARRTNVAVSHERALPPRATLVLFGAGALVAAGLILGLPWLATRIEQRFTAMLGQGSEEATAFSTNMVLGATRGMTKSDTVVMRIDGERPEYLRGAVYDRYRRRGWSTSPTGAARHVMAHPRPVPGSETARITLTRAVPNGDDMRWFVPSNACDVAADGGRVEVDGFGVVRRPPTRGAGQSIRFRTATCAHPPAPIAPPSTDDLDVPPSIADSLGPMAAAWTTGAGPDRAKVAAIQERLSTFTYSLAVDRDERLDPIVDFVTVHRAGHCEFFASALALMARTQGIPARVVGGYRVSEVNPITGYAVVRDRNAHTWVEAWTDGEWRAWDPTPASEAFAPRPTTWDHVRDLAAAAIDRAMVAFSSLGPLGSAALAAAAIALHVAVRTARAMLARRRRRPPAYAHARPDPLPAFVAFEDALTTAGHARDASEPLEAFARRLADVDRPWAGPAADALLGYAKLRYGGEGDVLDVVSDIERATQAIRSLHGGGAAAVR